MKDTGTIYGLSCTCCDDGIRYVGQTKGTLEQRVRDHTARSSKSVVSDWIHRHGVRHINAEALETTIHDELDNSEIAWISKLGTYRGDNPAGLNMTRGGSRPASEQEIAGTGATPRKAPTVLDWEQVRAIRQMHQETSTHNSEIARKFGVALTTVMSVVRGVTWQDPDYTYKPRTRGDSSRFNSATLTAGDVEYIRTTDLSYSDLAEGFGVTTTSIRRVVMNETWYDPGYEPAPRPVTNGKLTLEIAREMRELYATGDYRYDDIAETFGATHSAVADVLTNRTYKEPQA